MGTRTVRAVAQATESRELALTPVTWPRHVAEQSAACSAADLLDVTASCSGPVIPDELLCVRGTRMPSLLVAAEAHRSSFVKETAIGFADKHVSTEYTPSLGLSVNAIIRRVTRR